MARETRATPAMATLPIGDGRLNPYPFGDAGSSPATATKYFSIRFHKQFFVMAFTRHRREVLTVLL